MGERKVLQLVLFTCSILLVVLFTSCHYNNDSGYRGPIGGITHCCGTMGTLDTRGLILYYPMDDLPDILTKEMVIPDRSGRGNDGKFIKGNPDHHIDSGKTWFSYSTDGIIGEALHISKWDYIAILDSMIDEDFQFGTHDFTWSLWVRPSEKGGIINNNRNQVWIGAQSSQTNCGGGTHMWLGLHADLDLVIWQLRAVHKDKDSLQNKRYQHIALNTEGKARNWQHIVAVKDGHKYANVSIYINGKEVDEYRTDGTDEEVISRETKVRMSEDYVFSKIDCLYLGLFPACKNVYASTFTMDEVSIWNRPLSKEEVELLYKKQLAYLEL